jgi:outer membrane murein-binding lipoprotein Lpp
VNLSPGGQKAWNQDSRCKFGQTGVNVAKSPKSQIEQIEETQEALRESIEQAKELADQAHEMLKKHKKTLEDQAD